MKNNFDEKIFGVLDEKLATFRFKFFCQTDKAAEREFGDAVNNPKSVFNQHPEDFSLYCLGSFDSTSGYVEAAVPIVFLGRALDFVISQPVSQTPTEVK